MIGPPRSACHLPTRYDYGDDLTREPGGPRIVHAR